MQGQCTKEQNSGAWGSAIWRKSTRLQDGFPPREGVVAAAAAEGPRDGAAGAAADAYLGPAHHLVKQRPAAVGTAVIK